MKASAALIRKASATDLEIIADLRWRLQMNDFEADPAARKVFVDDFKTIPIADGLTHWLAFDGARAVGVMSVQSVARVPSPTRRDGRWGYLTNCYVLPSYRDTGVGRRMLETIKEWAIEQRFEMLVVWPSERAYAFYERGGFARYSDPLTLNLPSSIDPYRG